MIFICDNKRHLVCLPYTVENLHEMARRLDIKRCWFHAKAPNFHYDVPYRRIAEIRARCTMVTQKTLLKIIKGEITEKNFSKRLDF